MEISRKLSTKEKALQINLRQDIYGIFAEIGAGQEVAANFFKAGGASGTIAKTMSAYDMAFSDAIYGKCSRYVAEDRLLQMLSKEYSLLPTRLKDRQGKSRFFAFANTVEVLNYEKTNRPHGWMGLKFLLDPESSPNECIVHVNMRDTDNLSQQYALGIIGVNLIYACYHFTDPADIISTLMDELSADRIEIDFLRITGPDFRHIDNRLIALLLVRYGYTKATMFGADGNVLQPAEALYKKNVLMLRGRFKPVTNVNVDMLLKAMRIFKKEEEVDSANIVALTELTLSDLRSEGEIDEADFLNRADLLCSLGRDVMVSNYTEYYRLVDYLSDITKGKRIGIILGIYNLVQVFDENYYKDLRGGILEAFGILFGHNVKLYVYPSISKDGK
ncbi:MAG: TonB-dependent receptor, partial [Cyclobacteriaceae bacterium]|nr:TonB-dependent receptor [Cyclobacteriaceae bacterium]